MEVEAIIVNNLAKRLQDKTDECHELIEALVELEDVVQEMEKIIAQKDARIEDYKRILTSAAKQIPGMQY